MSVITIPRSLRERLGDAASEDFASLINDIDLGARKDAIAIAEERFERRLVEETGKLRVELRLEISKVNERITEESGKLRLEIEKVRSELSVKIEKSGKENVKWMFLFWIGQLAAMAALLKFFVAK
ncbi:LA_3696 family protein [Candidatus Magnetominusculus dajiuhuensis]|uniref:LA_3696 family protein n=1 Tax=Candidatus Magnetominusculus dajiuhuensis TaxID=3137712 RepID=UPI003B42E27C